MKVFVINGSPKGGRSNSYRLTTAFLEGLEAEQVRECAVSRMEICPCLGCFSCWNKTPGMCCIRDDMTSVIGNILWADVIIWSFPLYYFSIPGGLKNLIDRQLPMSLPFMDSGAASGGHPSRFDLGGKRHVVISTCGFYTARGNYDGVTAIFDHICGRENYTPIFCGQGELFRVPEVKARTEEYLSAVKQAGREFVRGGISPKTRKKLEEDLFPRQVFESWADASWGIAPTGEASDETLVFTRQMAALYDPGAYQGKDLVLEMFYTDADKRYQILLTRQGSEVLDQDLRTFTTCIETPFSVWKAIASGEISGQDALMQGKYRVKGDFDLMLHWDDYFGGPKEKTKVSGSSGETSTNMNLLLLPWIVFWVAAAINGFYGAVISIAVCAGVPLVFYRCRKTVYDLLSGLLVTACALALLLGCGGRIVVPVSYLSFGIMWTVSCFLKIPLTAHYSMNDYNGEEALENPLFMKTNRILTLCWGVLYLLTPIWTCFIMGTAVGAWVGAINSVLPALMGLFTAWFQKWYPAKIARGS